MTPLIAEMAQPVALPEGALIMQARLIEVEDKLAELEILSQKMALDIECLLLDPTSTFWYDKGHNTLQQHRDLMDEWYPQDHISPLGMD